MVELDLQAQKEIATEVLCKIDKICRAEGFAYSLAYGTLLGAVRHGGFIPWDDDIDIMMPRSDYMRFIEYCNTHDVGFELASTFNDKDYGYIFSKACDRDTTVIPDNMKWKKHGIQVDIFPIENLGDDRTTAEKLFSARRFQRELLVAWNWERYEKNPHRSRYHNAAKLAFFILSRVASGKALASSIHSFYGKLADKKSAFVGIVCGAYRMREIMPASIYEEYTDIGFEGHSFRTIAKYDEYLSTVYGNYMQLPPEDKRVTHHSFKAYRK